MSTYTKFIEQEQCGSIYYRMDQIEKMTVVATKFRPGAQTLNMNTGPSLLEKAIHIGSPQYIMETRMLHTGNIDRELAVACEFDDVSTVCMLLTFPPENTNCDSAIKVAISRGNVYLLRLLIDYVHKSEPKYWTRTLEWSLHISEQSGQTACTEAIQAGLKKCS